MHLAKRTLLNSSVDESPDVLGSHGSENGGPATPEGGHPEYVAFVLVPVFFLMGLLGFLICHLLKKKGYRCTTEAESRQEEEKKAKEAIELNESLVEGNNDTVGQIVNCIMKNQANSDAFNAMVADNSMIGDNSICPDTPASPNTPNTPNTPTTPGSPVSPESPLTPGATPSKHTCRGQHFHTVGGVAEKNVCNRCSHKKWQIIRPSPKFKEPKEQKKNRQAVTVLAVGRFRVTKVETKSKERKRLMAESGDAPSTPTKAGARHRSETDSELQDQSTIET